MNLNKYYLKIVVMYTILDIVKQILASNFGLTSLAHTILHWACFAVPLVFDQYIGKTVHIWEFSGLLLLPEIKFNRVWFQRRFQEGWRGCRHPPVKAPLLGFALPWSFRTPLSYFPPFFQQWIFQHLIWCGAIRH